ncbi:two-component system, OmpR family, sensor histidine kinase BaeS [Micromonospora phaseoli]|uniref:histidine kinase n=1 Tax=Micromonospora phaseoli TaxID=1144548 RepID=A0A1H6YYU6_9ACTN|nr:two-component system sensor histidine kinase BaeS [Micromonospora phaseoli]GIJ76763.1 two-component sensor histidine kinase [Micromonospora phaseoli]SEJ42552.1 two-component system, OmpR family, sensor histidine kinase BaeS [Micromonospora phaseoli]
MPIRHSLVTRLLVTSVLIAVAAIAATAWLATRTATRAISQEQGRSLGENTSVYDMLVDYAATHPDWSAVQPLIAQRAVELDRRITLMTVDRVAVIADTTPGPSLQHARPAATVDPLNLDLGLTRGTDRIDHRVVGPFRLSAADRTRLRAATDERLACLRRSGVDGTVVEQPNGRSTVVLSTADPFDLLSRCGEPLDSPTRSEQEALRSLGTLAGRCLDLDERTQRLEVLPDFSAYLIDAARDEGSDREPIRSRVDAAGEARITSCVEKSRRTLLQPHVAPAVLLFITAPGSDADQTTFTLSGANTIRIVAVTGAVLFATIIVTVLVGRRLVRPLRALTDAVDRQHAAPVGTPDEIGRLARALNDSVQRRDRAEAQRRAMVSDVAHELRTPLTNIRSWLEAAQDDLAPTDTQLLDLLHEEAVLLQHIIDDLTDLAAADAGTLRIHPEPTYVRDVLAQVVESHRGTAQVAGIVLTMQIRDDPVLPADAVRLRQIVGNLVSNAIRHTPPGGAVTVGAYHNTITVRDTGVGIAAENLPKIFDRFWRADGSRNRATGGSGLGLAITQHLVRAHGGTLTVRSAPGEGSLFTIWLPGAEVAGASGTAVSQVGGGRCLNGRHPTGEEET